MNPSSQLYLSTTTPTLSTGDRLQRRESRACQAQRQGPDSQGARLHCLGSRADSGQRRQVRAAQPRHWRGSQDGLILSIRVYICGHIPLETECILGWEERVCVLTCS